jgi:AmmeMemoRadiSam system protein B/AmmeMemoRadiSam system protein A
MKAALRGLVLLVLCLVPSGCGDTGGPSAAEPAAAGRRVREAAVAGIFYPGHRDDLTRQMDRFLADAPTVPLGKLRGLICPHAGYEFSGPTAARAYKQVGGRAIDTVVVLAPSHYADFAGAAIPAVDAFATPLGEIRLAPRAAQLAKVPPFCDQPADCRVQRPSWWRQASMELPPFGEDTPHTWEHSLEVQLPLLQKVLNDFRLVPAVFGRVDPAAVATALADFVDDRTLVIASSDLSHYYPQRTAEELDASCIRAICDLDVKWMEGEEACGKQPILTLMHLARRKGWKTKLLDYRTSGDATGDPSAVVGYAAIAFFEGQEPGEQDEPGLGKLSPDEQKRLLELARQAITGAVQGRQVAVPALADVPRGWQRPAACFVTLTKDGELRGCIGHVCACMPLYQSVVVNAIRAALADSRFPPVTAEELKDVRIEISILTRPRPLEFDSPDDLLKKLRPGIDGVMFGLHGQRATYLPHVWEQIPVKEEFLRQLAQKAQLPPTAWKDPEAAVLTYQATAFKE